MVTQCFSLDWSTPKCFFCDWLPTCVIFQNVTSLTESVLHSFVSQSGKSTTSFHLRKLKSWILCLILLGNFFGPTWGQSGGPTGSGHVTSQTVTTKYGSLRGLRLQFSSNSVKHLDPVSAYLGIPYASPPINAYRFMPPVAPLPWGQGVRPAISYPPPCPQRFPDISNRTLALEMMTNQRFLLLQRLIPHLANQSEDCLYLNFYVPTVPTGEEIRAGRFPILFIIHGESWEWGSGNEFDGGILASLGNHIVVTFNYRLGILGFMKTSNQQGNFGLLDVIAALHYVRENGDAFGGDRNRITLLGYKTGAVIANLLLIAQIAKDLFQRAILISGSVLSPWALQKRPEEIALQVANHLGCKGRLPLNHPESDLAPCLRKKHLSELLSFVPENPRFLSPFAPYVDNNLLRSPKVMMEGSGTVPTPGSGLNSNDQFKRSALLLAFTTSEGVHELNEEEVRHGFEAEHRDRILRTLIRNVFNYHQQEIFSIVRNEYTDWERPILHPIPLRDATVEALSDSLAIAPIVQLGLTHSKIQEAKNTYLLHFSHISKDFESTPYERLGSLEGDVVPYAMGLPLTNGIPALGGVPYISPWTSLGNFSKQDAVVSETLIHYLSNFVYSGDPNSNEFSSSDWNVGSGNSREKVRLRSLLWEPFESNSQIYMNLGLKPRLKNHYRGHKLALWLNLIPQIHVPGGTDVSPAHHTFQDHSQALYIGPVRQLYPLSFGDQIPGIGTYGAVGTPRTTPAVTILPTTTECIEPSTESSPFSKGILTSMDLDEEVRMNVDRLGSREKTAGNRDSGIVLEYDYTTALTVTLTVGVCLILLNLLVFSAIMCHRKRGVGGPMSVSSSGSPGSTHTHGGGSGGTPLKLPYQAQDDFKWMSSSCSSPHHPSYGMTNGESPNGESYNGGSLHHHGPGGCGGIPMNQYPGDYCLSSTSNSLMRRSTCPGDQTPSPLTTLETHAYSKQDYCCGKQQTVQVQIPNCMMGHHYHQLQIPPPPGHGQGYDLGLDTGDGGYPPGAAMRLYMNQVATGEEDLQILPDISSLPRSHVSTPIYSNTNSLRRNVKSGQSTAMTTGTSTAVQSPPSSSSGTTSVSTPNTGCGSNPSPSGGGNTTLVSALKRHSASSTPNSTIKKRVQIQEISV